MWCPKRRVESSLQHRAVTVLETIRQDAREPVRKLSTMRWGLMPSWAKDPSIGYKTINARAETVATTASFREPFKSQRCLVPADGFYEWQRNGKTKQPYCFEVNDGELFAFAGLWDGGEPARRAGRELHDPDDTPNSLLADIHDRMPVILNPDNYDLGWTRLSETRLLSRRC